ncbi:hypothetical protein BT63DRAFT_432238 [Microthyrium microscopicum]|uniref:Galactose oxidase n=1 Tax=Microthyrium microscopicum TaxID=703497 RepID=A0A6A6UFR5_9PEZI|nr:hypothetical protein BT63DRAFT_432238 [Microthyrium microscopicum]
MSCLGPNCSSLILFNLYCSWTIPNVHFSLPPRMKIPKIVLLGRMRCTTNPVGLQIKRRTSSSPQLQARANSPTDVCKRWSQQSSIVNGTLYLYGGRATTSSTQNSNTWNNDFLSINLKSSWQISSPPFVGLPQPSGPPAVANGYLWSSYDSLFLYGGEYSDTPAAKPDPFSLWEYKIKSSSWVSHANPTSSAGTNSEAAGQTIQRAAEGAGFSVPALGRGWYFGGHLDAFTTPDWTVQVTRSYLRSFVEFTFPGYTNSGVDSLHSTAAGSDGAWRNITNAGIQDTAGFTERADGLLAWVPGWGKDGIILSLAGGTNDTFTQMNEVDVYDIANSQWYRQSTSGPTPEIRVNPCAVVVGAADGSSYQVYMFGGQNLIPAGNQTQYNDMWILSVPSFSWIKVDMSGQSVPYGRAGHTCDVWDSQMVVVGGYIDKSISCESPGVYVFNTSSLKWQNSFNSLSGGLKDNPFSQQAAQKGASEKSGLDGSYGYAVPEVVYKQIGGSPTGGATITAPVATAVAPFATGKPYTYTVTGANGATITETSSGSSGSSGHSGTNVGAAVAGSVAGVLAIVAGYLAFCALLYRKQLGLYKAHVAAIGDHPSMQTPAPYSEERGIVGAWHRVGWLAGRNKTSTEGSRWGGDSTHSGPAEHRSTNSGSGYAPPGVWEPNTDGGDEPEHSNEFEPSYWGVLLHPRRSLRVVNR